MRLWARIDAAYGAGACALTALACVGPRGAAPARAAPAAVPKAVPVAARNPGEIDGGTSVPAEAAGAAPVEADGDAVAPATVSPTAVSPASGLPTIHGQLNSRYRGRFTSGESDHDLYETVDLAVTDPGGRWSGALLARAAYDMDGKEDGQDDFFSLLDTYDHSLEAQLFHAYLDVHTEALTLLRFGRQPLYETPVTLFVDGVRAEAELEHAHHTTLGAFAGLGEHMYESSSQGDVVFGTFGSVQTWTGAELRVDWMHLEDERLGVDHEDDLLGVTLDQDFVGENRATRLDVHFNSVEGNGRDVRLSGSHVDSRDNFSVQGSIYKLLQTQFQLAAPLDPFSDTLFELFPYYQLGLSATKDWSSVTVQSGVDVRRVEESADEGEFNRDFERYYLTGTLPNALPVSVSMTGEAWRATDADFQTWGASLAREFSRGWDATLGSQFSLYEYDLLSGEERDHVRSTYLDLRWKTRPGRRWMLRYAFERNDIDDYHQVTLDYVWTF